MLNTKSVKHNYRSYLWVPDDVVEVAEQKCLAAELPLTKTKPLSLCLRVLEVKKDARLKELDERGVSEEELTEEMLWLDIEWPRLSRFALRFCGASSLQKIFPVVMQAGFARQRYIKRHPKSGERICDENGVPLVYATYHDGQLDEEHPGTIIHQALFESEALSEAIAALDRPPSPSGGGSSPSQMGEGAKNEGTQRGQTGSLGPTEKPSSKKNLAARVGNYNTTELSRKTIPSPSPNCEGGDSPITRKYHSGTPPSPICEGEDAPLAEMPRPFAQESSRESEGGSPTGEDPLRQSAHRKSKKSKNPTKELSEEESTVTSGVAAADTLSHFDFFREFTPEAVLDLASLVLPLPSTYKSQVRREAAVLATQKAATELAANVLLRQHGLVHLARLLFYFADETSPCKHRAYLRQNNPGLPMRLWMLTESVIRIASKEMDTCNWWPSELSRQAENQPDPSGTVVVDLAELAGVAASQRQGMDRETTEVLLADLNTSFPAGEFPGVNFDYGVINRRQKSRGYYVEFWPADGLILKLYSLADWERVVSHAQFLGSPEFVPRLANACQANQVA